MTFGLTGGAFKAPDRCRDQGATPHANAPTASASTSFLSPPPLHTQLALLSGLHAERSQQTDSDPDRRLARITTGSLVSGLMIWGFVLYAVGSTVLSLAG